VSLRKIIKGIFKRFGLDRDTLSCHSLRRSFAVVSYETGSSIYDIQQVLHHSSINTTTRYLKQVDRDNNKTEYNVANAILGGM
jgi:integrase